MRVTHLEHLEDLPLQRGNVGFVAALTLLDGMGNILRGKSESKITASVKWDGAPSIFVGFHPQTNQFFVSTKSIFNKVPKIAYNDHDVDVLFGESPGLAKKLKLAIRYLPQLNIRGILQGDFLYSKEELETKNIDGETFLIFKPNTITYAIPKNSDSAKKIEDSVIGIAFHTRYTGERIESLKASPMTKSDVIHSTKDVYVFLSTISDLSGKVSFTKNENEEYQAKISAIRKVGASIALFLKKLSESQEMKIRLQTYYNSLIRKGNINASYNDFAKWLAIRSAEGISKLKSLSGRERAMTAAFAEKTEFERHAKAIDQLFFLMHLLSAA
jgi:hypothetical protein